MHGVFPFAESAAVMNAILDPMTHFRRSERKLKGTCVQLPLLPLFCIFLAGSENFSSHDTSHCACLLNSM